MLVVRSLGSAKKGCICHAIRNEGERIFPNTTDIYIYMKADKGLAKIKFCYPMFACEGKL